MGIRLVERDYRIMKELDKWRWALGRHIRCLVEFTSVRSCDRRLKILVDNGFLERKHYIYGVPQIYQLTNKAKKLLNLSLKKDVVKLELITHNIAVLDTVIWFQYKNKISLNEIQSEKELHRQDGFSNRKHRPDFVICNEKNFCIEVELNLKSKDRFIKNIKNNFMEYDKQIWIVPKNKKKIKDILEESKIMYPNIEIYSLDEVQEYVRSI